MILGEAALELHQSQLRSPLRLPSQACRCLFLLGITDIGIMVKTGGIAIATGSQL
jgi:hypothetical protein